MYNKNDNSQTSSVKLDKQNGFHKTDFSRCSFSFLPPLPRLPLCFPFFPSFPNWIDL